MKTIFDYIKEGYDTTSKLEEVMDLSPSTIKRMLNELVSNNSIIKEGNGPTTKYRALKPTPAAIDILEKMRLYHQQKSMNKDYRRLAAEHKCDIIVTWYVDTFPGLVKDYDETEHQRNITSAWAQLEKELA